MATSIHQEQTTARSKQRGAVLGVALILLLVITILAVVGARTGIFELRMALNEESRVSAFERAQSIIDWVITERSNLLTEGGINSTRCTNNWGSSCSASVTIPSDLVASGATARMRITQASDYVASTHPSLAGSTLRALYVVEVVYDATAQKLGRADLVQGIYVYPGG